MSDGFNVILAASLDAAREGGKMYADLLATGKIKDMEELASQLAVLVVHAPRKQLEDLVLAFMLSETLNAQADAILSKVG